MKKSPHWPSQAFLEAIRPEPDQLVRGAILTSYSADVTSIAAALLALAGRDSDNGSGGKADLAEAVERLRGKVRILVQHGRLARPKQTPTIAGIFDQFVRDIHFDEDKQSWHPKICLVQFAGPDNQISWRLWLGSRNLTSSENRDFGLLLTSSIDADDKVASAIPGVSELGSRLADLAGLGLFNPGATKSRLAKVRWKHPDGMRIERVTLTSGLADGKLPTPPDTIDEVIVVSPFLDGTIVGQIGGWGGKKTRRILLSTMPALSGLAGQVAKPLAGFGDNILTLEAPVPEPVEPAYAAESAGETSIVEDGTEEMALGLHAKIIAVRKGKEVKLWVGSPNATGRAWKGTNVEVFAEISTNVKVLEALLGLIQQGRPISAAQLSAIEPLKEDDIAEALNCARKRFVATWQGRLVRVGNSFTLTCDARPHPDDNDIELEAGLATGSMIPWSRTDPALELGDCPRALQTELVQFRLSLGKMNCSWLQRVAATPSLEPERDRDALARHLGMGAFLEWIAALMSGEPSIGQDDPWDQSPPVLPASPTTKWLSGSQLSLEAILASWARDPAAFKRANERLIAYLDPVIAQAAEYAPQDIQQLRAFKTVWHTVSEELLKVH